MIIPLHTVNTGQRGLPRPVATAPDRKLRPVPFSQVDADWGISDDSGRLESCHNGLCLICGEFVQEGVVLWDYSANSTAASHHEPPAVVEFEHLGYDRTNPYYGCIGDGGAMHDTCVKLTRAHCRWVRDALREGKMTIVPYIGPTAYGLA